MTTPPREIKKLGQFLSYVLGRRPDEFGLIPDNQGYVLTKELLKALYQEAGWRHVRMAHLHQIVAMMRPAPIELEGRLIRATVRDRLPTISRPKQLPKLLFMAIRRRAYTTALTKGLSAGSRPYLILSSDRAMAQKIGRRLDNDPVVLTIQVAQSQTKGTCYQQYSECLFLADTLAIGTFSGPAAPKEREPAPKKITSRTPTAPKAPGSYLHEWGASTAEEKEALKRHRRRHKMALEKARRQARRQKSRR